MAAFLPLWRKIGQDCFAFLAIFKTEVVPSLLACFWDSSISMKLGRKELSSSIPWKKSVYIRALEAQNARYPFPKSHHCTCGGNSSRYFAWDEASYGAAPCSPRGALPVRQAELQHLKPKPRRSEKSNTTNFLHHLSYDRVAILAQDPECASLFQENWLLPSKLF